MDMFAAGGIPLEREVHLCVCVCVYVCVSVQVCVSLHGGEWRVWWYDVGWFKRKKEEETSMIGR